MQAMKRKGWIFIQKELAINYLHTSAYCHSTRITEVFKEHIKIKLIAK